MWKEFPSTFCWKFCARALLGDLGPWALSSPVSQCASHPTGERGWGRAGEQLEIFSCGRTDLSLEPDRETGASGISQTMDSGRFLLRISSDSLILCHLRAQNLPWISCPSLRGKPVLYFLFMASCSSYPYFSNKLGDGIAERGQRHLETY